MRSMKKRSKREQRFEYRIRDILESKGYLVINPARSKPFDLVVIRNMQPILIELKGAKTRYPKEQKQKQIELCKATGNEFVVIKQSKRKGKIRIEEGLDLGYGTKEKLKQDLSKYLESK